VETLANGNYFRVDKSVLGFATPGSLLAGRVVRVIHESWPGFVVVVARNDDKNREGLTKDELANFGHEFMMPISWIQFGRLEE
jgi:hypothetical protein